MLYWEKIEVTPLGNILFGSGQIQNQFALYSVDALITKLVDPTHSFGKENPISIFKSDYVASMHFNTYSDYSTTFEFDPLLVAT